MTKRRWWMAVLAMSAAALVVACGDDDDATPAPDAGGADGGDDQDAGGTGGSDGGGAGADGGGPVAKPVPCGSVICQPPTNPLAGLAGALGAGMMLPATGFACCRDEEAGECGYSMTEDGETCNEPAVPDTRCPNFVLPLPLPVPPLGVGCCIDDMCGVDGQLFGNGCVENDEVRELLSMQPQFGELLAPGVPPARRCDAPDAGEVDQDGGN